MVVIERVDIDGEYLRPGSESPGGRLQLRHALLPADFILRELLKADLATAVDVARFVGAFGWVSTEICESIAFQVAGAGLHGPVGAAAIGEDSLPVPWQWVALELRCYRAIVRHWIAGQRGEKVSDAWRQEGFGVLFDDEAWKQAGFADRFPDALGPMRARRLITVDTATADSYRAWELFREVMDRSLRDFHVTLTLTYEDDRLNMVWPTFLGPAICLQLWNAIADCLEPRECANERCSHLFTQQQFSGTRKQVRSKGVLYCSNSCARAQAERERRRRNKNPEVRR